MRFIKVSICTTLLFLMGCTSSDDFFFDADALTKIKENTFIIVPINVYAPSFSEEEVQYYHSHNCNRNLVSPSLQLNCEHLENCEGEECSAPFKTHGTAFLLENGTQLITAWHVVFESHSAGILFLQNHFNTKPLHERRSWTMDSISPHFVLLNHEREIVFDTRKNQADFRMIGDPITPVDHMNGRRGDNFYGYHENIPSDWTIIDLPFPMGDGLKLANDFEEDSAEYFNAGFGFDRYQMRFSIDGGKRRSVFDLNSKLGFNEFFITRDETSYEELSSMEVPAFLSYMGYTDSEVEEQMEEYFS